ncbi:MAG: sigma-54-dependent Fis family transcriptional regulator [Chitinophagaceae bacterium]|nr:MAG: sigma-54-dependent Fis family transcriptional regulator [Chitinophagaceae bacterium]
MILIIDDDLAVRTSLQLLLQSEGFATEAAAAPEEAIEKLTALPLSLVLLDLNFSIDTSGDEGMALLRRIRALRPALPVILITGWGTIDLAVKGMKLGASDFINKPWENGHVLQSVRTLLDLGVKPKEAVGRRELDRRYNFQHIIGEDPRMLALLETVGRVADTDAAVLIMGESGTGKELIAEAVHQNSKRRTKPFVKVNLGGISTSLFESEMFGHVRGSFTDARFDRTGRFELAGKGTIFLDEIGDLDGSSQVKLLRVLQDRTYEVLGSSRTRTVDVRVVCATNRNLEEMVSRGTFREDLLYRINLITLRLPPLRERPKDIPLLVDFFLNNMREMYGRPGLAVTRDALKWLQGLPLPGNIRQLKNLVERTVLVSAADVLDVAAFRAQYDAAPVQGERVQLPGVGTLTLEEVEVEMIRRALAFHNNKIARAAVALGLTRSALYRRLEKYNIPFDEAAD